MGEIKCVCIAIALKKRDLQPEVEPKLSSWVAEGASGWLACFELNLTVLMEHSC